MNKRLLKIDEAAAYAGLSPNEIRVRISHGTFPFVNISKGEKAVYRFDLMELDKWCDELPGLKSKEVSLR